MTIDRLRNTLTSLIESTQKRINEGEGDDSRWVAGHLDGLLFGYKFALDQLPQEDYDLVPLAFENTALVPLENTLTDAEIFAFERSE